MRVLVTGAHGFIGFHLCRELKSRGHHVLGLDRIHGQLYDKSERASAAKWRVLECELSDYAQALMAIGEFKPEVVVNLAGQYSIPHSPENMRHYIDSNVLGFLNVAEAASRCGAKRLLDASSIAVADNGRPSGLYGATKAFEEQAAYVYSNRGLGTCSMRIGVVYGPMHRTDTTLYKATRSALINGRPKGGKMLFQRHSWIDVRDLASVIADLSALPIEGHRVTTLCSDNPQVNVCDCVEILCRLAGARYDPPPDAPFREINREPLNISGIRNLFPDLKFRSIEDTMRDYYEWIKRL